jgi:amiloride-sensitive sodium channel
LSNSEFLITLVKPNIEIGFKHCKHPSFRIHHPHEVPTFLDLFSFREIEYGTSIDVEVTPEITKTDPILLKLSPDVRECFKDDEKKLKFFKIYTQQNCEVECFTNYTIDSCNCTFLTQPYNPNKNLTLCIQQRAEDFTTCETYVRANLTTSENFSIERNCQCLPTCDSITYRIKQSTEFDGSNETTIRIKFNMDDLILYRRYQQFTFSDVVSYVGGLLGLFAGISMLSIVEIFYFFTIRLAVDLWRVRFRNQ